MKAETILSIIFFELIYGGALTQALLKPGVLIEGDIMLSQNDDSWDLHTSSSTRTSIYWPGGIVPYDINQTAYSLLDLYVIHEGLKEIEKGTCIEFVARKHEKDYIYITPHDGCWSYLGRKGSNQVLSLMVPYCIDPGTIIHEFMHALGFWHEHSRPDRDDNIEILWENIINEEKQANFAKHIGQWHNWNDFPYDYQSVMHYPAYAFSKSPSLPTLKPRKKHIRLKDLGRAKVVGTLTDLDRLKINAFYDCKMKL